MRGDKVAHKTLKKCFFFVCVSVCDATIKILKFPSIGRTKSFRSAPTHPPPLQIVPRELFFISFHSDSVLRGVSPPNLDSDSGASHNRKRPPSHIDARGENTRFWANIHSQARALASRERKKKRGEDSQIET